MQGSNNGKIKMARQRVQFDDANWGYSSKNKSSKVEKKNQGRAHREAHQSQHQQSAQNYGKV